MNRVKQKVHITSHGQLNYFNYNGLRTPAFVDLCEHEIVILKNMGVEYEIVKDDKSINDKVNIVDIENILHPKKEEQIKDKNEVIKPIIENVVKVSEPIKKVEPTDTNNKASAKETLKEVDALLEDKKEVKK